MSERMPALMWACLTDYLPLQDMRAMITVSKRVSSEVTSAGAKARWFARYAYMAERRCRVYEVRMCVHIATNTHLRFQQGHRVNPEFLNTSTPTFRYDHGVLGTALTLGTPLGTHGRVVEHVCNAPYNSFIRLPLALSASSSDTPGSSLRVALLQFDVDGVDVLHIERLLTGCEGDAVVLGPIGGNAHLPSPPPSLFPLSAVYVPNLVRFTRAKMTTDSVIHVGRSV